MSANDFKSDDPVLVTESGLNAMRAEYERLDARRRELAEQLATLENDYEERLEAADERAFVEARIATLEGTLRRAKAVEAPAGKAATKVAIGSNVTVEMPDGATRSFRLVGATEANPAAGAISYESPLGAALLGKKPGDRVRVQLPAGPREVRILSLE